MFTDVSHLVAPLPPGRYSGAAVCDVDGDGSYEVVLGGLDGPNRVLKWVGGLLRDATPPGLADPDRPATALATADINADGLEELYVATAPLTPDRLFAARPDGTWEDLFARPDNRQMRNVNPVTSLAALNRRGNGRYGFLIATEGCPLRLLELSADNTLTDLAPAVGLDRLRETEITHLLPVPLVSARLDVFASCRHDSNALFVPETDGTYNDVAWYGFSASDQSGWMAIPVSAGDRFGLVAARMEEDHALWLPQPDGSFRNVATPAFAFPSAPSDVVVADFDNDGAEEVLFLNIAEPHRLFRPGPHLVESGELSAAVGPEAAVAVGDFDRDGRMEVLVARATNPAVRLYRATGPDHAWLRVQPLTRFGAPARGATVLLESRNRTLFRVIPGTASTEPVAHFGLGPDPAIDRVTVTWPDGAQYVALAPDARRVLRIPYPGG